MNPEALVRSLERDPFIPLRLHLTDGRVVDILNPGLCFIAHLALYFFRAKPHTLLADDVQIISLRHIVTIENMEVTQSS